MRSFLFLFVCWFSACHHQNIYSTTTFWISKNKAWVTEKNTVIHEWVLMHEWIFIVVPIWVIYSWYAKCKSSCTVYYIDFTLLFWLIRCFKKEIMSDSQWCFPFRRSWYCYTMQWNIHLISLGEIWVFYFHLVICVFHTHLCNNLDSWL